MFKIFVILSKNANKLFLFPEETFRIVKLVDPIFETYFVLCVVISHSISPKKQLIRSDVKLILNFKVSAFFYYNFFFKSIYFIMQLITNIKNINEYLAYWPAIHISKTSCYCTGVSDTKEFLYSCFQPVYQKARQSWGYTIVMWNNARNFLQK